MEVLRTKSIEQSIQDTEEPGHRLRRSLGPIQLTVIGIGVIIGTGIFVLTGEAAGTLAGPAIALSFAAAAVACALAGLCYAEFASVVPVAGSAYTFSYASLGELVAWIIGWDLMLELALGAATVASGWSQYFKVVLTSSPWHANPPAWIFADGHNLVAAVVVLVITGVLCLGMRTSSAVTAVIVVIKVAIVLLVIIAGLSYIKSGNYHPFIPPSGAKPAPGGSSGTTLAQDLGISPGAFGVGGIFAGAALVFFAFIGFD
ncbi:MAG: basic amino acid/polyamine antiporter, family, partial [Solirubrobacteraceae bacterium]|nr:basic amino acid/polyamine antiporter, family [Solirubrobacteraceae bacterium]